MGYRIDLHLIKEATADADHVVTPAVSPIVLVMASDQMGRGEKELESILIWAFLGTLSEVSPLHHRGDHAFGWPFSCRVITV